MLTSEISQRVGSLSNKSNSKRVKKAQFALKKRKKRKITVFIKRKEKQFFYHKISTKSMFAQLKINFEYVLKSGEFKFENRALCLINSSYLSL